MQKFLQRLGIGRKPFDPMQWTPEHDPRVVLFLFESPEPFMLPNGTTYSFLLDREVEWLRNVEMRPIESVNPVADGGAGHLFVSFRFWRSTVPIEPPLPTDALMEIIKLVMPPEKATATRVGVVGLGDDERTYAEAAAADDLEDAERGDEDEVDLEHDVTIIEAVTPLLPSEHNASPIVEALHRCMDSLAEFSRVYRLSNKLPMQPITYERLPPEVFWATRKLINDQGNEWDEGSEFLLFPSRMPGRTQHGELDEEGLRRFNAYYQRYRGGYPLIPYSERTLDARLSLDSLGDYTNCVIQSQTAVEVLFDALLSLLLWEERMEPEKVAKEVFNESLHKRVRTHFGPRLGGDWNTKGNGAVGHWAQILVPLRNGTVHAAYRPTREEAGNALDIVSDIDQFFRSRLVVKRNEYMRTALMILGQPGLERHGAWSGKIKSFAERADEEPSWDQSFSEWQKRVLDVIHALDA